ncbi:hypothetical protein C8024_03885 [Sphingopyxis sp. BSNA05]|uniref:hypothetical protein n=1 Tax=Sphingopyxis sp. BSNA05 TaxID=1236614 RepID=UPI0015664E2E|nr:hypothetical protein [Sphingopyxis sp. BSNA05]NRD88779.1 hypothetical protein [Sphingopyxis sp. BSNA05]
MACFAISYQLNNQQDYPKLWAELDELGGHKVMRSFYFLDVNNTATEVKDHLISFVDDDDMISVVPFDERPSCYKCNIGTKAWLDARF